MCGRYTLRTPAALQQRFSIDTMLEEMEPRPRYNIAPTQRAPVVVSDGETRRLASMRWGLVPSWSPDGKPTANMINARMEGIAAKPAFRQPLRSRRCIIPADGMFEWAKVGKGKQPYYVHFDDDRIFGLAGLYDIWRDGTGGELYSFTIITATPNSIVSPLHDRMAVILAENAEEAWLDPTITQTERILPLLTPYPAEGMAAYPIGMLVNHAEHDSAEIIAPIIVDTQDFAQGSLFA